MKKRILSLIFVFLLVSSSMGVAEITPPAPRTNELGENVFGEQETGESILVEAYKYEPKQVSSGVLEEQPVPVYVFLKATTLGGLLAGQEGPEAAPFYGLPEIKLVSNPVVVGGDRRFVGGITFVPSNRGRRTLVDETGRFIDLGYFIVRLNKIDKESDLPGFRQGSFAADVANVSDVAKTSFLQTGGGRIDLNVSLDVRFAFENSLGGFGANDLLLGEQANEAEWRKGITLTDSFWNGKGYVRANRIDEKSVNLVVYDGNLRQIGSVTLTEGQESRAIALYMYPFTLVDRFRIQLQKIDVAADKARLLVNDQIVLRGKGERLVVGSDWIVDKITRTKQLDGGISVEEVALRNTKTGELKPLQRKYQGDKTELRQEEFSGMRATTTTTVPATPAAPRAQAGDVTGEYADLINKYARLNNLEPAFVKAMIAIESSFDFKTVSRKKDGGLCGAVGLMQLISGTAAQYGRFTKERFFEEGLDGGCNADRAGRLLNSIKSVSDDELKKGLIDIRFNPEENIKAGSAYLGYLYGFYKSKTSQEDEVVKLTVAAYNAGEGNINKRCEANGYTYAACEPILEEETKGHVVKFLPVYREYKLEAAGGVAASPAPPSVAVAEASKVEATAIENDCRNFKDFAHEKLDEKKSADELHCKAIQELEKTLTLTDDENVRGEAYYWIGENYFALGGYQLALGAYEKVTGLYQIRAQSRMVDATERLKGKVLEETKAYLDEEGLQVAFLGIRELQLQEGPEVYIRVNKGEAKKFGLNDVLPTGNLNDGKFYQLKVDAIDRAQIILRKVYEDKSLGSQIIVKEGGQRAINEGVQVTLDVVDIKSKDVALITILPGSGRAVSRSYVQLHIPVEQRAIQFSGKQIDWQINKTQALIQKMDTTIARMNTWLQRWKLACFGVYGFLTLKNFLKGGDDVKARDIVYRGMANGKGIDDLICNEQNIGYNKQYQSADECRLKNRKVLEGFVDATKGSLRDIENFNGELNALTDSGKKPLSKLSPEQQRLIWERAVGEGQQNQFGFEEFQRLVSNNAITKEEVLQAYKNKELSAAYVGQKNNLIAAGGGQSAVENAVTQQGEVYASQLKRMRESSRTYAELEDFKKSNQDVPEHVKQLMFTDSKLKTPKGNEYRVYRDNEKYFALENGKPIELEQRRDDKNNIILDAFVVKGQDVKGEKNWRTAPGGVYELGKIQEKFSRDKMIRVDQNGRVTRMPWEKGKYIEVLEWYQNGDPKTMRVVAYRDVGGVVEEVILHHQSAIDANLVLKSELERTLRKKPFCKPGDSAYSVEGVVFTCNLQLPREETRGIQCQDVMPAADCAILFNVCDPVICPASRFDLGGRWKLPPGRSVVDTGVIGALTLGMPNFVGFGGENVIPPVCGPGVLAGLESWRSMLQAYNQCMIASKTSGKTVGICDAIRSVYVCEILWREAKSFGGLLGGLAIPAKARGGGEYTDFQRSLTAIGDSAKFFTQEYGRSSFAAFKSRSLDEAGTEFCKAAYFGKAPGFGELLNKLAAPESPPQFTAWFDAFEWTGDAGRTALNPGLSLRTPAEQNRYAVYYHIYAGHDREVRYSVWLQDRTGSVRVPVTNALGGYTREVIQKGGYADKQVEIIAGKGLEQVCVEINAAIFCGFGKVATGFLQNYVNDVLVKNELGKEITNEKDCVGDTDIGPSVGGVALPTQAGFGTSAVRRICSLKDPDEGSNQDRWKVVGSCGKGKNAAGQVVDYGICWIDAASLNLQFRNLDDAAKQRLGELGKLYPDAIAAEEKLKRERFEPLFKKLEGLFTDIVKVNGEITLRKKQEVIGKYPAAMDGVSSLIATSLFRDADYQYLVENAVEHAGNASLRIGQLYMALADLKKVVEEKEVEEAARRAGVSPGADAGVTIEDVRILVPSGILRAALDVLENDVLEFYLGDDKHRLEVFSISTESVTYEIASEPEKFTIAPEEIDVVDFENDGWSDLVVEVETIEQKGDKLIANIIVRLPELEDEVTGCYATGDAAGDASKKTCLMVQGNSFTLGKINVQLNKLNVINYPTSRGRIEFQIDVQKDGKVLSCGKTLPGGSKSIDGYIIKNNDGAISEQKTFTCEDVHVKILGYDSNEKALILELESELLKGMRFKALYEIEKKKGGGGSGDGGEKGVSELTIEWTPLTQKRGDVYTFSLFGDTHTLTILNIVDGVVAYRLGSEPFDFTLKPGQYAQVDADEDGSKELFIELKEIKKEGDKFIAVTFIKAVQGSCRKARATDAIECVLKMGSEDSLLGLRVKLLGITELDEGSSLVPDKLKQYVYGGGKQVNFALSLTKDGQPIVCKKLFGVVQQPDISVIFSPGELFTSPVGSLFPTTVNGYFYYKNKRVTEHKTTQCTDLNVGAENVILSREELFSIDIIDYFPKDGGGILEFNLVYPGLDKFLSEKNMRIEVTQDGETAVYRAAELGEPEQTRQDLDALKKEAMQVLGLSERDKQRIYSAKDKKGLAQTIHDVVWGGTIDSDRNTAIALLKIAEMVDADNAQVQFRIGYYLSLDQKYDEALPHFENAVRLDPRESTYKQYFDITRKKVLSSLTENAKLPLTNEKENKVLKSLELDSPSVVPNEDIIARVRFSVKPDTSTAIKFSALNLKGEEVYQWDTDVVLQTKSQNQEIYKLFLPRDEVLPQGEYVLKAELPVSNNVEIASTRFLKIDSDIQADKQNIAALGREIVEVSLKSIELNSGLAASREEIVATVSFSEKPVSDTLRFSVEDLRGNEVHTFGKSITPAASKGIDQKVYRLLLPGNLALPKGEYTLTAALPYSSGVRGVSTRFIKISSPLDREENMRIGETAQGEATQKIAREEDGEYSDSKTGTDLLDQKAASAPNIIEKVATVGFMGTVRGLLNEFARTDKVTHLDITDLYAVYIDPVGANDYFIEKSDKVHYKALIALPLGWADYTRTRDKSMDSLRIRRNANVIRPNVGNFYLDGANRLRVTFDNIPKKDVLFQLKVEKTPDEDEIPKNYQGLNIQSTKSGEIINALVLTESGRYVFVKGAGKQFFDYVNRIAQNGYVFQADAGINSLSYSSDIRISRSPGWSGIKRLGDYNNVALTSGLAFYDTPVI